MIPAPVLAGAMVFGLAAWSVGLVIWGASWPDRDELAPR